MGVAISGLTRRYAGIAAVDGVALDIRAGEFFAILGPSGCGKSTLLRLIAGLETADCGTIAVGGRPVTGPGLHLPPESRGVGVVFQSYALWPHMTVRGNVAFPVPKGPDRAARVDRCLATVALQDLAARKPADLSGGQRQRVALARCLAQEARTILMDEPLANLDPHLRQAMEEELAAFHRRSGATTLYITHDQAEAMAMADRVAVMWAGRIEQAGTPEALYRRPATERVAGFVGRGAVVPARVLAVQGGRARVALAGVEAEVDCPPGFVPGPARLLLRPEDLEPGGDLAARVASAAYRGGVWEVRAAVEGLSPALVLRMRGRPDEGAALALTVTGGWVLPA